MKTAFVIGRVLFGGFFLYNGINHFRKREELAQYAGSKKVSNPEGAVVLSGLAILLGGASIVLGAKPKLGAAAIAAFLASVSPVMHPFWNSENPQQQMNETINFSKNMALLGAALTLMGRKDPWPASAEEQPRQRQFRGESALVRD